MSTGTAPDFRLLFESAPGLYLVLTPELRIVAVSDAYAQTTMTRREDILGRQLFDVFPDNPEDPQADGVAKLRASLTTVLTEKKTHTMALQKYPIRRPDGSFELRYWSPINKPVLGTGGEVLYIIHRVEDVTEFVAMQQEQSEGEKIRHDLRRKVDNMEQEIYRRSQEIKQMNAELERQVEQRSAELILSEKRYRTVIESMMEGMQVISREFRYLYVNDAVARQSQQAREALLGRTMMECFPGIELTEFFGVLKRCMQTGTAHSMENEFRFRDGSSGVFELSIQPIPEGVFILSVDITARKSSELALAQQNRTLQSQNRELEQFTYIASHDLQEPLRTIKGFAHLMLGRARLSGEDETVKQLGFILDSVERMSQLTKGLLDYSRIGRQRGLKQIDCNQLLAAVIGDLAGAIADSGAQTQLAELPVLYGYELELRLLFQNLLSNAIKFRHHERPLVIRVSAERQQHQWLFQVADNGIGIDAQHKDKIFVLFKRLHNRSEFEGTGIGLAQCKKIVELHGGEIWVSPAPDGGSLFHFSLTRLREQEGRAAQA